ncbi:MAG: hypothetical protein MJK12_01875 [Colwellia sp.]|nr:hypothetical protein [Colwellia sp.]
MNRLIAHFIFCYFIIFSSSALADAVVINKSMQATTIAQYYIDDSGVKLNLEIEVSSIEPFKNLLPDELYKKMGYGEMAWADRLGLLFTKQLALKDEHLQLLSAKLTSLDTAKRILRDRITGLPLANQQGAPTVLAVEIVYFFNDGIKPTKLTFITPKDAGIGFIAYHNNVAINDFRYLSTGLALNLDWQDAWYSHFDSLTMKRQYWAPMSGFLYIEPFEVRKEIIVRPKDIQRWLDIGLANATSTTITPTQQKVILDKIGDFLKTKHPVLIDGVAVKGELQSINFLARTLNSSSVIPQGEVVDVDSAIVGAIFIFPRNGTLPKRVTMNWDLWDERTAQVPVSAVDELGPMPSLIDAGIPTLVWDNVIQHPKVPVLMDVPKPASAWQSTLYKVRYIVLILFFVILIYWLRQKNRNRNNKKLTMIVGILLVGNLSIWAFAKGNITSDERVKLITKDLLHNIYRAFDYRDDNDIYDVLALSVTGDLLTDIYLQTKKGLILANQGGARAKVKNVTLDSVKIKDKKSDNEFVVEASWLVDGSVGHWGHIHQRKNRYHALLTIAIVDNSWKVEAMTVLQEERVQ